MKKIHNTAPPPPPSPSDLIPDTHDPNNYCVTCDRAVGSRYDYLKHLASFHLDRKPELYQGTDCKNSSKKVSNIQRYCADCQKEFLTKIFYEIHMNKIHGKPPKSLPTVDDPDVNNPNNYFSSCKRTYNTRAEFRKHLVATHHLILPSISERRVIIGNEVPVIDVLNEYCNV